MNISRDISTNAENVIHETITNLITPAEVQSVYEASDEVRNLMIPIPPHFELVTKLTHVGPSISKTVQAFNRTDSFENVSNLTKHGETYPNGVEKSDTGSFRSNDEYDKIKLQRIIFAQKTQIDSLENQLKELAKQMEGGIEMSLYSQKPFNWLFGMTFAFFTVSLLLMLSNLAKIGATIGFFGGALLFISLYALWRFNNIALIRPKSMVLGFVISLSLFLTGITRLL